MSPFYRFRAMDWSGRKHKGILAAADTKELLSLLQARELIVTELVEEQPFLRSASPWLQHWVRFRHGKTGSREMMIFCLQFATLIQTGTGALHALQLLAGQMERALFRRNLEQVAAAVARGNSLADSFSQPPGYFPDILIQMVKAGETGGALDKFLELLAEHYERQYNLEEKIRSATVYPLLIIGVATVVMAVMVLFVLPQFAIIFNTMGLEMPLFASVLLRGGTVVRRYWPAMPIIMLLVFAVWRRYLSAESNRLKYDRLRLNLPYFGRLYRQTLAARFARILGLLLGSGLSLVTALELSERALNNRVLSRAISRTREAISQGRSMAEQLKSCACFPPLLVEMFRIGESSGALEEICARTADYYERELSFTVSRLGSVLEPILLLLVALFVGALVFSILTPIYQVFRMI